MKDYNWDTKEPDDVGSKGALNNIGSKATKIVFDVMGYQLVKAAYDDIGSKVAKVVLGDVGRELTGCTDNFDKCTETLDLL